MAGRESDAATSRAYPMTAPSTSRSTLWIRLSIVAAVLAFGGSIVALANPAIYEDLTDAFLPQALAQDIANLVISPLLLACGVLALRGSMRGHLIWLGVVAFTLYNYVIYAFSIPFGPLFPIWVAVLSLALFSLIGGLKAFNSTETASWYTSPWAVKVSAWVLLVVAGLFALIWFSEDLPALVTGSTPQSAVDMAIPTNPVHILDYVFFLPAAIITGVGLLRRTPFAFVTAPAFFVFLALTCVPILITPLVHQSVSSSVGLMLPIGLLALTLVAVVLLLLKSVHTIEGLGATAMRWGSGPEQ